MAEASTANRAGLGPHLMPEPCKACGQPFSVSGPWHSAKRRCTCSEACKRRLSVRAVLKCRNCKQHKPREMYDLDQSSVHGTYVCRDCKGRLRVRVAGMGPHQIPHPCVVCGKRFELTGAWSHVKKQVTCSHECKCRFFEKPQLKCKGCQRPRPRELFDVYPSSGKTMAFCRECRAKMPSAQPRPPALCRKCGILKRQEEFGRYPGTPKGKKHGQRKTYCLACETVQVVRGRGPHKAPHPCCVCGKEFLVRGYWSHVKNRKTCSHECFLRPRQSSGRSCSRCKKHLRREEFDCEPGTTQMQRTCRKCVRERDRDRQLSLRARPTAFQIWRTAKLRCQRDGLPFELTSTQARTLYKGYCELCGRAPSSIQPAPKGPLTKTNCRLYCRRCVRLLAVYDHQELFLLAHEIAARNPLTPPEVNDAK